MPHPPSSGSGPGPADPGPRLDTDLARWLDALQLLPLAAEGAAQPGTHLRVLFRPAFHPPACLTLHAQEGTGMVEVVLPGPAIWDEVRQQRRPGDRSPASSPGRGDLYWATAPVPSAALAQFQEAVAGIVLTALGDTRPANGRDGMLIDGEVVAAGVAATFAAWSPTAAAEPAVYRVCMAVLELGQSCLPDESAQAALGQIQSYLHPR